MLTCPLAALTTPLNGRFTAFADVVCCGRRNGAQLRLIVLEGITAVNVQGLDHSSEIASPAWR